MSNPPYVIPVWDTVYEAWEKINGAKSTIWKAIALIALIMFGFGFIEGIIKAIYPALDQIVKLMGNIISYLFGVGILYIGIQRAADKPITFRQIFRSFDVDIAMKLIGVYLLIILLTLLSLLPLGILIALPSVFSITLTMSATALLSLVTAFLCICGIILVLIPFYILIRLQPANALVLDQAMGPWDAIKTSWCMTRSNFWHLVGLGLIQAGLFIIGSIPLGIGLIWVLPYSAICYGLIYKKLLVNK